MLLLPAILENYRSLNDKTLKIVFHTNELTPEQHLGIAQNIQQFGYLAFKNEPFKNKEKEALEAFEGEFADNTKSHAKRLRNVLYRLWEQDKEGYQDSELYYRFKMEKIISFYKEKLP